MFEQIIFYRILGMPLLAWGGLITLLSFLFTAYIAIRRGKTKINFKWHPRMAKISITLAFIHGILAVIAFI